MDFQKFVGAAAAVVVTFGIGSATVPSAWAADNIKIYGEQESLNGPNSQPYISYTVYRLKPSNDPVPHNGQLFSAKLRVDGDSMPMISGFGARAESGAFYPAISGASTDRKLYFDVVGPVPNSVVWNNGSRDILAWIQGDLPREPQSVSDEPPDPEPPAYDPFASGGPASTEFSGPMPREVDPALVATPNDLAQPAPDLSEAEVASPGFNAR